MNKYIVLSAAALVISLAVGCQNCGYKTAHCSRYQSLVGTTRLASPQTNCRYNSCNAFNTCNACNTCNTCDTQMLANNGQFCSNPYAQNVYPNGYYQPYAGETASASVSLLDGTQQTAQSDPPLRWRSVTEEEQQYANSSVNPTSAGVASALSAPAFGSPAPAPSFDPQYPTSYNNDAAMGVASALSRRPSPVPPYANQYPGQYPNSSPRVGMGVPNHPLPPRYPGQYPNSSPRVAEGVASALSPGRPMPGPASQYPGQYPNSSPRTAASVDSALTPGYGSGYGAPGYGSGYGSAPNSDSMRWRRVTEEEQQYPSSSRRSAPGAYNMTPGYGSPNSSYPNSQYADSGMQEPLTVPVYPENSVNADQPQGVASAPSAPSVPSAPAAPSTSGTSSAPEIDPNALPMLESPAGTF